MDLETARRKLDRKLADYEYARRSIKETKAKLKKARLKLEADQAALEFIQGMAKNAQQKAHKQISYLVTRCLKAVFDDPYEFKIMFEKKRSKTEARLVFIRDGEEFDPMKATGGGVVDVAAFALRLVCLIMSQPAKRRILFLDESFRFVSQQYRPRVKELIETLAEEMGVQIILVTHAPELQVGKVIQIPLPKEGGQAGDA